MDTYINEIINNNKDLFKNIKDVSKINIGFTNLIYSIGNEYIIKICNNKDNEDNFKKEIDFYNNNKSNPYIPKLYSFSISNSSEDYSYEIIEKVHGKSLYFVWHEFNEEQRKNIIKEIVKMMKSFHSIKGESYDWAAYIINKLKNNFDKCYKLNLFSLFEKELAFDLLEKIKPSLQSEDFRLVHSDIHFDNIIFCENETIKIIDFETSIYAPIDYELDIFLRMCSNPLKYASEETEKFVKEDDYKDIEKYFRISYPEIYEGEKFDIRHQIYNLEANLRLLSRFPNNTELKNIVVDIMNLLKKMLN